MKTTAWTILGLIFEVKRDMEQAYYDMVRNPGSTRMSAEVGAETKLALTDLGQASKNKRMHTRDVCTT